MGKTFKALAAAMGLLALGACGSLNAQSPAKGIAQLVQQRFSGAPVQAPAAPALTRATVDANPAGAFIVLSRAGSDNQASLVQAAVNGQRVTWLSADQVSVTLQSGLLVASRGFVQDLMASDVTQVITALVNSGGTALRAVEYLDGLDQITTQLLQCSIASGGMETLTILEKPYPTERFNEECANESIRFTNVYWINDEGRIVQSRQLVSQGVGFIEIQAP